MTRKLLIAVILLVMVPSTAALPQERSGLRDRIGGRIEARIDRWRNGPLIRRLRLELVAVRQERRQLKEEVDRLNRLLAEERAKPPAECPAIPVRPSSPIGSKG